MEKWEQKDPNILELQIFIAFTQKEDLRGRLSSGTKK